MMNPTKIVAGLLTLALFCTGCGSSSDRSEGPSGSAAAQSASGETSAPGPAETVRRFLEAIKAGDQIASNGLLSTAARAESEKSNLSVAPPGSPTAVFEVGEVEFQATEQDRAHVASTWTDIVEGEQQTDKIVWILRKESAGWRISGMATKVFEDMEAVVLNFEDHKDLMFKQQKIAEETERRARAETTQAKANAGSQEVR